MKKSVLLTGGLGYVGGRLALGLRDAGYHVYCGTRRTSVLSPQWFPSMKIFQLDWKSKESLLSACKEIDCVIHLAAMNEIDAARDPVGSLNVNGIQTLRLLEAAKDAGVKRFIYFSTAHVYGSPLQGFINEKTLARPVHPYAISHRVSEDFVLAAHDSKKIEGVVFRLSNGFGAPVTSEIDRWTLLVNDLCKQAVTTGKLTLKSSGLQLRDFITLGDVTKAAIHMVAVEKDKLEDGLFNLGSGTSLSILKMTELVAKRWLILTGQEIKIFPALGEKEIHLPLNFCCDKITCTGLNIENQYEVEIDNTLKLCLKDFSN